MSQPLTQPNGYNTSNMMFSDPKTSSIPTKKGQPITYQRINITTKGKKELIFPTPNVFSFGPSENTDPTSGRVTGYVLPFVLYDRDGATEEQKKFVTTLEKVIDACRMHVLSVKAKLGLHDLVKSDLRKIGNALYYKTEKGKRVPDKSPVWYCKLLTNKTKDKIISSFYENDNPIDPLEIIGKRCTVQGAVKVESIFVGRVITIQFKCLEANIELHGMGRQRMLLNTSTKEESTKEESDKEESDKEESDKEESDKEESDKSESDDSSKSLSPPPPKKKVVKRRVVRRKKAN